MIYTWNDHGNIYILHDLVDHQVNKIEVPGNHFWEIKPSYLSEYLGKRCAFIIMKGTILADIYIPHFALDFEYEEIEGFKDLETIKTNIIILDPYEKLIRTRTYCKNDKYETDETIARIL